MLPDTKTSVEEIPKLMTYEYPTGVRYRSVEFIRRSLLKKVRNKTVMSLASEHSEREVWSPSRFLSPWLSLGVQPPNSGDSVRRWSKGRQG